MPALKGTEKMTTQIVRGDGMLVKRVTHHLHLNVKHPVADLISSTVVASDSPLAAFQKGDRINIGALEGYPEARQTSGIVRQVSHTFTGAPDNLICSTLVEIDEVDA
jgi:hypothetical protein